MINIKVLDIRSKKEIPFMLTLTGNNEVTLLIDTYEINTKSLKIILKQRFLKCKLYLLVKYQKIQNWLMR